MGYGSGWGMMEWGNHGFFPMGMIIWVVVVVVLIALVIWGARAFSSPSALDDGRRRSSGLDVLEERYARGELSREEYLQKKADILGR